MYNNSIFTNTEHCVKTNIHSDMDLPLLLVTSLDVSFLHLELAPKSLISKNYQLVNVCMFKILFKPVLFYLVFAELVHF